MCLLSWEDRDGEARREACVALVEEPQPACWRSRTAASRQRCGRLPFPSWLPRHPGRDTGADPPRRWTGVRRTMSSHITSLNSVSEAPPVVAANRARLLGRDS